MIEQGMRSLEWSPFGTEIPPADFVMIARGMGADGVRVEHESQIDAALELAMHARGPFVLDVVIDPSERAPSGKRNQSLARQGVK
jgi:acetolactate synthase-1/2/3 large subunit